MNHAAAVATPDKLSMLLGVALLIGYWFLIGWACYSALGGKPKSYLTSWVLLGAALAGIVLFGPLLSLASREFVCHSGQVPLPDYCASQFSLDWEDIGVLIITTWPIMVVALLAWSALALRLIVNQIGRYR
jgi:hypothetical protein